jgi:hypothetical protein
MLGLASLLNKAADRFLQHIPINAKPHEQPLKRYNHTLYAIFLPWLCLTRACYRGLSTEKQPPPLKYQYRVSIHMFELLSHVYELFCKANINLLAGLATIVATVVAAFALLIQVRNVRTERSIKKDEEKRHQFRHYHQLIKTLFNDGGKTPFLTQQLALIYELRHFDKYHEVSYRMLNFLIEYWELKDKKQEDKEQKINYGILIEEANLTITHIKSKTPVDNNGRTSLEKTF